MHWLSKILVVASLPRNLMVVLQVHSVTLALETIVKLIGQLTEVK